MGIYTATIDWSLGDGDFASGSYSRAHTWLFDGGISVPASASPGIVPLPHSIEEAVDPEEAFVASLSSCHMLFFLSLAAARGIVIESYRDHAAGVMEQCEDGKTRITQVTLRPEAQYRDGTKPSHEALQSLHDRAHHLCYIANSVTAEVTTEIIR